MINHSHVANYGAAGGQLLLFLFRISRFLLPQTRRLLSLSTEWTPWVHSASSPGGPSCLRCFFSDCSMLWPIGRSFLCSSDRCSPLQLAFNHCSCFWQPHLAWQWTASSCTWQFKQILWICFFCSMIIHDPLRVLYALGSSLVVGPQDWRLRPTSTKRSRKNPVGSQASRLRPTGPQGSILRPAGPRLSAKFSCAGHHLTIKFNAIGQKHKARPRLARSLFFRTWHLY